MKKNSNKNNILESLVKRYEVCKEDIEKTLRISGVDSDFLELISEILGVLLNKTVWLSTKEGDDTESKSVSIKRGTTFDIAKLLDIGYERVERVWNEGEVSVLGDVVLIWPFSMNRLIRLSILDSEIENISVVDVESRKKIKDIGIRNILGSDTHFLVGNEESEESVNISLSKSFENRDSIDIGLRRIPSIEEYATKRAVYEISRNYKRRGYEIWYLTNSLDKYEQKVDIELREYIDDVFFVHSTFEKNIKKGFVSTIGKVLVLTDLEVLGEIDLSIYQKRNESIDPSSVEILKKILPGDYVVHEDHGIGKFTKVVSREHGPYIEIAYAGKDKLYVPLTSSDKLTKYIGAGKNRPILTGLNSGVWKRISKKAKDKVDDIAKELLQLYALRKASKTPVILESEDDIGDMDIYIKQFEFQDTDDQILSTDHIVRDFQNDKPMDRLLVGDVGYGKTEIASRAMFAVVNAGYQVAFLAPTTILVEQHTQVLKERFKQYPFNIVSLSRFSSKEDRERVLEGVRKGSVDIVVGTHALLSKDVVFKDLGLLVIDEEQKFGVKQKEEIKAKRVDTNVLSLTATPIPRTLNMALMGIRDISVLATPPEGRKEVVNRIEEFNWESIKEGITKELNRGGQVYFLHNRVLTIGKVYEKLVKMFPQCRIDVAHGQMSVQKLSNTMKEFSKGNIDILICTTIIENGLDIPNVNTLIIEDATMLGLSQMYQIRGRVGRSKREAYAYFFYNNLKGDSALRLEAIKETQELGSGFLLSNKDLEIRGAGDILGKNQSGTINSVGYGLYSQMLERAVREVLKVGK